MKPDLIIVSNELQGDASDFVREWRTDIHLLDTPIAVVMKNAEPKIQEEYLSAGANIVISKSIPNLDFLAKVKSLLKIGGEMVPVQAGELRVA
jgi:CheY-like chemotaxis protein